jgi:hypothetical protein
MKRYSAVLSALLFCVLVVSGCGGSSHSIVPPPVQVTVSVPLKRVALATTQSLSVAATTNDSAGVTWTSSGGSFSDPVSVSGKSVAYIAPGAAGTYTIKATSVTNPAVSASFTAYVTDLAGVTTYHNSLARDGANTHEYALTPATVTAATFGKLFSCPVDGAIYTQPLWMPNLTIGGAKHNVVFVATQHDSLYAVDADASPCVQLWKVSLIDAGHGATAGELPVPSVPPGNLVGNGFGDIAPEVGVTGTPVIDATSGTLYVVSKSVDSGGSSFFQRLHALDLATGTEKLRGPANIGPRIQFPGTGDGGATVSFNAQQQNQRPGLALVNGMVYVAWASHEDAAPYYGWVVAFSAADLTVQHVLNVSPNVQYGGIWMGGGAPAADASGHLYVITGNATFDANSPTAPNTDYGDSFLQMTSGLGISSYFTPSDEQSDANNDADFGSGGSAVVVNVNSGGLQHLVIGGGKDGGLYLLDGDHMGGLGDSKARQTFNIGGGIFATGAFWNNNYFIATVSGPLANYAYDAGTNLFNTQAVSQSSTSYGFPGATPSISASGDSNGIVWALDNSQYCTPQSPGCGAAVLHAYSAQSLSTDLWNSSMVSSDAAGYAVKFTVPTIANGRVYVGTRGNNVGGAVNSTTVAGELDVYGLKGN